MGNIMLLLAVLLGSVHLLEAQDIGPERGLPTGYTAEFYSEGDHNTMGTGLLTCSLMSSLGDVTSDVRVLQIIHNNEIIADTSKEVEESKYILAVAPTDRRSEYTVHLRIADLSQADAGIYTCKAYGERKKILSQTLLQFDVNFLPDSLYPTCSMLGSRRPSEPIQSGESITLLCSSKLGKPTVQLKWQEESGIAFTLVLDTETEQYVQSEVTLDAIYEIDGLEVTCISQSEAFPEYVGRCTVGPLNIAPPSDEGTTGVISTDGENIAGGAKPGEDEVNPSSATPSLTPRHNPLLGDDFPWLIVVVVLSMLLCISIIFNIISVIRSKRRAKTVPVTTPNNQTSDSNYQGLNNSAVTQGQYTALNTQEISLKTVTKKSTIVNYTEATAGEEDYAQVDNPQSPRSLTDTVERYQKSEEKSDSAYVNLNIPSRSKLR